MKVFEAPYFKATLIETFGLTATNNNSVTLPQTDKGYAIRLNGSNQSISYTGSVSVKSVIIFLKANGLSKDIIDFDGGTHSIEVGASNITATGFVSPTFYVDTVATAALPNNLWKCVIVTTATAFTANAIKIGRETSYFKGDIAYVCFDNAVISANDIGDYQKFFVSLRQRGKSKRGFLQRKATELKENGLIAAYNFIPNGNTLVDISGGGNNMTLAGSPQPTNNGIRFDGVNDKGTCTGSSGLNGNVTISTRIKLWGWGGTTNGRIFTNSSIIVWTSSAGQSIGLSRDNTVTGISSANSSISLNRWHTVTIASTSSGVTNFYIDGVLSGSANQAGGTPGSSTSWIIGDNGSFTRALQGEISDLRIYNRVLTAQEIKNYHNLFAKVNVFVDNFSDSSVNTAMPRGFIPGTGVFKVSELTADVAGFPLLPKMSKVLECTTGGTIKLSLPTTQCYVKNLNYYNGSSWSALTPATLSSFVTANSTLFSLSGNMLTITLVAGRKLANFWFTTAAEV